MRTIACLNRKGGTGKTRTTIELAYVLATIYHQQVLVIDGDSQANATRELLHNEKSGDSVSVVLEGDCGYYPDLICHTDTPMLDVLPASEDMTELDMACLMGRIQPNFYRLHSFVAALAEDNAYDVVLIDCPPYYSYSCVNAIAAADWIIIPTNVDAHSAVGMSGLVRQIDSVREISPNIKVAGTLITRWRRSEVGQQAVDYIRAHSPVPVLNTVIRKSDDKVEEATWARQPVQTWSPTCSTAKDYRALAEELMERGVLEHGKV